MTKPGHKAELDGPGVQLTKPIQHEPANNNVTGFLLFKDPATMYLQQIPSIECPTLETSVVRGFPAGLSPSYMV